MSSGQDGSEALEVKKKKVDLAPGMRAMKKKKVDLAPGMRAKILKYCSGFVLRQQMQDESMERKKFPSVVEAHENLKRFDKPSMILPHLYLGRAKDLKNLRPNYIRQFEITHILNTAVEHESIIYPPLVTVKFMACKDNRSFDIEKKIYEAIDFIETCRKKRGRCLVICHAGRNRSATMIAAYLMSWMQVSSAEAVRHIRIRRGIGVLFNAHFRNQLAVHSVKIRRYLVDTYGPSGTNVAVGLHGSEHLLALDHSPDRSDPEYKRHIHHAKKVIHALQVSSKEAKTKHRMQSVPTPSRSRPKRTPLEMELGYRSPLLIYTRKLQFVETDVQCPGPHFRENLPGPLEKISIKLRPESECRRCESEFDGIEPIHVWEWNVYSPSSQPSTIARQMPMIPISDASEVSIYLS